MLYRDHGTILSPTGVIIVSATLGLLDDSVLVALRQCI